MEWVKKNTDGSGHGPGNLDWHGNGAGTVQYFTGIQTGRVFGNRPVEASVFLVEMDRNDDQTSFGCILATFS